MSRGHADAPEARLAMLLQALDLRRSGRPLPEGALPAKQLARTTHRGWLILSRASRALGIDAATLTEAAEGCPILELGDAEPPRMFGLFKRRPEPAVRWTPREGLEGGFEDDPETLARGAKGHRVLADRLAPVATTARARSFPGKLRRPPRGQRYMPPTPSREALLMRADRSLVERYALEEAGDEHRRRRPRSPLRFGGMHPAHDLSSAVRLLVTADATEAADRMRSGALAAWFRDEAGEEDLAAVVDAATHAATERGADDVETRALLLKYIRRTAVGADLEHGLIEPMADALRSRDGALVASTAQALLLLDADLAAAELSSALFETEVEGRSAVIAAMGETGSPRAVAALEHLARAATLDEDRREALAALRRLAREGAAEDVAGSALRRLGQGP